MHFTTVKQMNGSIIAGVWAAGGWLEGAPKLDTVYWVCALLRSYQKILKNFRRTLRGPWGRGWKEEVWTYLEDFHHSRS